MIEADTFTKVFPISRDTNNLPGESKRFCRYLLIRGFDSNVFCSFFLSNENSATSDPAKNADRTNRNNRNPILYCQSIFKYFNQSPEVAHNI
jgi:hypothetical protein